ncbi:hypothetical protein B0H15DRAFT_988134 [Mycena belliarum]|uniref:Uncharacterized protein n=1 Tax=Mycena belliarum TaxID=1033014 RepID=A0AAD6TZU5_9AGAR|nr:hypothetical protein B0H15DRAFT_988134 [Mycena belliae]
MLVAVSARSPVAPSHSLLRPVACRLAQTALLLQQLRRGEISNDFTPPRNYTVSLSAAPLFRVIRRHTPRNPPQQALHGSFLVSLSLNPALKGSDWKTSASAARTYPPRALNVFSLYHHRTSIVRRGAAQAGRSPTPLIFSSLCAAPTPTARIRFPRTQRLALQIYPLTLISLVAFVRRRQPLPYLSVSVAAIRLPTPALASIHPLDQKHADLLQLRLTHAHPARYAPSAESLPRVSAAPAPGYTEICVPRLRLSPRARAFLLPPPPTRHSKPSNYERSVLRSPFDASHLQHISQSACVCMPRPSPSLGQNSRLRPRNSSELSLRLPPSSVDEAANAVEGFYRIEHRMFGCAWQMSKDVDGGALLLNRRRTRERIPRCRPDVLCCPAARLKVLLSNT